MNGRDVCTGFLKKLVKAVAHLVVLMAALFGALLVYVATGPRSLDQFTPYIEQALSEPDSGRGIKIHRTELVWDSWRNPAALHVKDVELIDTLHESVIAYFPEIIIHLDVFSALIGRVNIDTLEVMRPSALLLMDEQGNIALSLSKTEPSAPRQLDDILAALLDENSSHPLRRIQTLSIREANLSLKRNVPGKGEIILKSQQARVDLNRVRKGLAASAHLPLEMEGRKAEIEMRGAVSAADRHMKLEAEFLNLPSQIVADFLPSTLPLPTLALSVSGWVEANFLREGKLDSMKFMIDGAEGELIYPEQFENALKFKHIRLEGAVQEQGALTEITSGNIEFDDFAIALKAILTRDAQGLYGLSAEASTAQVPLSDLKHYWPKGLSPLTRTWVTERITEGLGVKGAVKLNFKPGELGIKITPDEAVSATIEVKGASVLYMPSHPKVTGIDAVIDFTGSTMKAKVARANYLKETALTGATLRFDDLNAAVMPLFMEMEVESTAKDVAAFLALSQIEKAKLLGITEAISGRVQGKATLDFIAFSDDPAQPDVSTTQEMNYHIEATLDKVSQTKFLGKRDIADAAMHITLDNKGVKATGSATVNGLPMQLDVYSGFERDADTIYHVKTEMPVKRMPDFDLPAISHLAEGTIGMDAKVVSSDTQENVTATLDLSQVALHLKDYDITKPAKEKAVLTLATRRMPSGNTLVEKFELTGEKVNIKGSTEFDRKAGDFAWAELSRLKVGRHDLTRLYYRALEKNGTMLEAEGKSLDAAAQLSKKSSEGSADAPLQLKLNLEELWLGETKDNAKLSALTVIADCKEICHAVDASARLPGGEPLNYRIDRGVLTASCNNAGELLRVLGIYPGIEGGKLALSGAYPDGVLTGKLLITDYTLKNAPVMAKMLTIASLTGVLNTLTGNGINFSKLSAPYKFRSGIITLKDAKAYGSALGITADGTIDIERSQIDIGGALVPSYTLNTVLGNVPVVGDLLMGGEGKGVIAINYSMKGSTNDPAVGVNPLSVLTPGFLRGIFDVFDHKPAATSTETKPGTSMKQ